jgi:hypothetical protein
MIPFVWLKPGAAELTFLESTEWPTSPSMVFLQAYSRHSILCSYTPSPATRIGVGIGFHRPRPPNRTGGFPAYGSPVGGFFIETVSRFARLRRARTASHPRSRRWPSSVIDQRVPFAPLTPLTSADSMRSVHTEASTQRPASAGGWRLCTLRSLFGTCRCFFARAWSSRLHLPAPPSLGWVLLPHPSVQLTGHSSTMRALTPAALRRRSRSLRSVRLPSRHPAPNHVMQSGRHVPITSCARSTFRSDFAIDEQARRCTPPKRVRHPTGCRFVSSCSPPRLAATQLARSSVLNHLTAPAGLSPALTPSFTGAPRFVD